MRKKVAVVILSWNGKKFLEQFLPSVVANTTAPWCEIIVADNQSTDDSILFLKTHYPDIRVILNARNGGYAGGYNDALKEVDAEYFVLLNQDIEVTEGWVEKVVEVMDADKNIAAAQPKLRDFYKREFFEYAGASGGYIDKHCYSFCRGRMFDTIEKDIGQYNDVVKTFWATGACMFIRKDAFEKVGGFDEDFFAHQEEIDLCWRLNSMGYSIVVVPASVVYHVGGGSLPQGNPRKTYLNFRNNLMMMFKNLPLGVMLWKVFVVRFAMDGLAAWQSIIKTRKFDDFLAVLKAHVHFLMGIPGLIKKRREVTYKSTMGLAPYSVVWQYFAGGKKTFRSLRN